jgi:hypothetical protein
MSKSYWVIGPDGQSYGPADESMLAQWTREGRLVGQSALQDTVTNQRVLASQVPAVAAVLFPGAAAPGAGQTYAPQTIVFERSAGYAPSTIVSEQAVAYRSPSTQPFAGQPAGGRGAPGAGAGGSPRTIVADLPAPGYQPREAGYAPQTVAFQQPVGYQPQGQAPMSAAPAAPGRHRQAGHPAGTPPGYAGAAGESPRTVAFEHPPAGYQIPAGQSKAPARQPQQPVGYATPQYGFGQQANAHSLTSFDRTTLLVITFLTGALFPTLHFLAMHGKMPKNRPDDPGTGKAIGLMFVPVFNIYWAFFAWLRLFVRINEQRRFAGLPQANLKGPWLAAVALMTGSMLAAYAVLVGVLTRTLDQDALSLIAIPVLGCIAGVVFMVVHMFKLQGTVNEVVRVTRGPNA